MAPPEELWATSRKARLASARAITSEALDAVHTELCRGRTEPGWPYGSATPVNPVLVVLGPSPGNSPKRGDRHFVAREPFALPTSGEPHPGVWYDDPKGYWNKIRELARAVLDADGAIGADAFSLFGTMNLSSAASGNASSAPISTPGARWVLATIRDGLRPRVLVLLGMRTLLTVGGEVCGLLEHTFKGVNMRRPHREYPLDAYTKRRLTFREWDTSAGDGAPLLLVDWPQHPNRAPFTNARWWSAACEQFAAHHPSLIE